MGLLLFVVKCSLFLYIQLALELTNLEIFAIQVLKIYPFIKYPYNHTAPCYNAVQVHHLKSAYGTTSFKAFYFFIYTLNRKIEVTYVLLN